MVSIDHFNIPVTPGYHDNSGTRSKPSGIVVSLFGTNDEVVVVVDVDVEVEVEVEVEFNGNVN